MKEEVPYQLPEGWGWTTLGELGIIVNGGTPSTNETQFWGGEIPWVTPADLSEYKKKYLSIGRRNITKIGLEYSSAVLLPEGSLIYSSRAPIGYIAITQKKLATNQGFKNLIPVKSISVDYLYYYLLSAKQEAIKRASGTTFLELSTKGFARIPVPLPTLEVQQQIVLKIEELFNELFEAEASLTKALKQLEAYNYVILKAGFDGRLTSDWRAVNKSKSAVKYLAKIETKKQKSNTNKKGDLFDKNDGTNIYQNSKIPTWATAKLGHIVTIAGRVGWKGLKKEEYTKSGPLFLSVHSLNYGKNVNFKDALHISKERYEESPNIMLRKDDVLLCKDGSGIGKVSIIAQLPSKATINSSLLILRGNEVFVADFLYYLMRGPQIQEIVNKRISGSAIPHLFQKDIKDFILNIPPLEEQQQIISEIEYRLTISENLSEIVLKNIRKIEVLKQSIFKTAFRGLWVSTNINPKEFDIYMSHIKFEKEATLSRHRLESKVKTKREKIMKDKKSIIQILKDAKKPISAKDVWLQSKHKDDIEGFYSELRELQNKITEIKKDTESLLTLRHEN